MSCVYVITFKTLLGQGQDFSDFSLCINIRSTNQLHVQYFSSLWKMTFRCGKTQSVCFTMLLVNGLMQIDLFNNNNFSLFAFVLLLTLRYTHPFVCKGCYIIPQEINL